MIEEVKEEKKMSFLQCFTYKQTWAFAAGKFMTDGVWWFFLFWTPSYLNTQFDIKTSDGLGMALIFTLYAVTMLSIYGGKLPTIFINKTGMNPYAARMKAMLILLSSRWWYCWHSHWVHSLRGSRLSLSVSAVLPTNLGRLTSSLL